MTIPAKAPGRRGSILVILLLAPLIVGTVLVVAVPRARTASSRTVCATRLKSLGAATAIYAAQYNDALPTFDKPGGSWMCDQPPAWASLGTIMGAAAPPASFRDFNYCPSNANQDPATLWGAPAAPYRVTGYGWTNDRPAMPPLAGLRDTPPLEYHKKFSTVRAPADAELALDWIISDQPDAAKAAWTGITAKDRPGIYDTSHLTDKQPAGANILMFDGHVEWRNFNPAKSTPVPQSPAGPCFWFPGR